jgi:inosine/xanthosine triphosphatase
MKKIIVASKNPVKINSILNAFVKIFPDEKFEVEGVSVPSGVSDQPMGEDETIKGATTRVANAQKLYPDADYWAGLEGGIVKSDFGLMTFGWIVVKSKERIGYGRTVSYFIPPKVAELVLSGKELGEAMDITFQKTNSKQDIGASGILTNAMYTRTEMYMGGALVALIPFLKPELYPAA